MTTLADFLLARIAEDEAVARKATELDGLGEERTFYGTAGPHRDDWGVWTLHVAPARVLAECEAKRRIVQLHAEAQAAEGGAYEAARDYLECVLREMAWPYADHQDYRQEWSRE